MRKRLVGGQRKGETIPTGLRQVLRTLSLFIVLLILVVWAGWGEVEQYRHAESSVVEDATAVASSYAAIIADRFDVQFTVLEVAAVTLSDSGADLPRSDRRIARVLRRFARLHPNLRTIVIQNAARTRALWSSVPEGINPPAGNRTFTPLPSNPDFLLGQVRYGPDQQASAIMLQYRMRDARGTIKYLINVSYPLRRLLMRPGISSDELPWRIAVIDGRDGGALASWPVGRPPAVVDTAPASQGVTVRVPGYPFVIHASWPAQLAWNSYRKAALLRWEIEGVTLVFLILVVLGLRRSLREQTRQSQELDELNTLNTAVFDGIGAMAVVIDSQGRITRFNRAAQRFTGYSLEEVQGQPFLWERFFPEEKRSAVRGVFNHLHDGELPEYCEQPWINRDGVQRLFAWNNTVVGNKQQSEKYLVTIGVDITERTAMEAVQRADALRLQQLTDFNYVLAQANQIIAIAQDAQTILQQICELAIRHAHLKLAFVARPDEHGVFLYPAAAGELAYLDGLHICTDPNVAEGQGSIGAAWREGIAYFNTSFESMSFLRPMRERALNLGLKASAVLPVRRNGQVWAILAVFSGEPGIFDGELRTVLEELAADISRGLDYIAGRELQRALLDNTVAGILLVKDRVIQQCNGHLSDMLGRDAQQIAGQSTRVLYPDDEEYERIGRMYATLQKYGTVKVSAVRLARHDRSVAWCDFTGVMLPALGDGMSIWTVEDITVREEQRQRLERLAQFNALLADVNHFGTTIDDAKSLFDAICSAAIVRADMLLAWIGRPDPVSGEFDIVAASGESGYLDAVRISSIEGAPGGDGPTGKAWREGQSVFVPQYNTSKFEVLCAARAERYRFGAFAALPIHSNQQVSEVFTVYLRDAGVFDDEVQNLLNEVVSGIERGLATIAQKLRIANLQQLYRALMAEGDVVLQARSDTEMLRRTCTKLVQDTMFRSVWIVRPDEDGRVQVLARAGGGFSRTLSVTKSNMTDVPLLVQPWNENITAYNDDTTDQRTAEWLAYVGESDQCAAMTLPLRRGGSVFAVMGFVSGRRDVFDSETKALCQRVTDLLGHGLDELDLKQRLTDVQREEAYRARHDLLTGLPNRYALEQHLPQAVARARRQGTVLAVGMIDLDEFKPVNDTWGHEAGDRLLREMAKRLRALIRESDFIARLGGDEFIAVIENLDELQVITQLTVALERLHNAVNEPFSVVPNVRAEVGMTMGVALFPLDAEEPDALLRQADAAMYQAKLHKTDRKRWWRLTTHSPEQPEPDIPFDAYGENARFLLSKTRPIFDMVANGFVDEFYTELAQHEQPFDILSSLNAEALTMLKQHQLAHLAFLLDPETTQDAIREHARHLGQVHTLIGVGNAWLIQSVALYRRLLGERLNQMPLLARERYLLLRTAESRLQDDMQAELDEGQTVNDAYMQVLSRPHPLAGMPWADVAQSELNAIASLPGIRVCAILRPNAEGIFQIEGSSGELSAALATVLSTPGKQITLDIRQPGGRGLVPLTWRTGEYHHTVEHLHDVHTKAWHDDARQWGIHSMVAVPIPASPEQAQFILAIYGAYPRQFGSVSMGQFIAGLQQRWGTLWQRSRKARTPMLSQETAQAYREQLFSGGLRIAVQPVMDLHTGQLIKAEALARLALPDGQVVLPGVFLPLLGAAELDHLFRLTLDRALGVVKAWESEGLVLDVAVNLPPSTLTDQDCPRWVEEAVRAHEVAPHRLKLELLESQPLDNTVQDEAIDRLHRLGIGLAMDDLGAGYSSLLRLAKLPFDTIKVDQGLLLRIRDNPVQTLSLIRTVIQIGCDFERRVVVEGLEDASVIEAVAVLGAQYGQGFGIARPMPAEELVAWDRDAVRPVFDGMLNSYLGALACHWGAMHAAQDTSSAVLGECPLAAFLEARGLAGSEPARWLSQVREGRNVDEASRLLMEWLVQRYLEDG